MELWNYGIVGLWNYGIVGLWNCGIAEEKCRKSRNAWWDYRQVTKQHMKGELIKNKTMAAAVLEVSLL